MMLREVTVGRSKDSDIYLDDRCVYASNRHASIYYDGNQLMFRDNSSNGTMINNIMIKRRAVPIRHGDIIMIAGRYQLNWNQIDAFFPPQRNSNPYAGYDAAYDNRSHQGTEWESPVKQALRAAAEPELNLHKWNWGAFCLSGIWGLFNGCWWMILINLFCWWLGPIPNIIFGIYGTRWAWENKSWSSTQEFVETQASWAMWGIIIFSVSVLFGIFWSMFFFAAIM